MLGGARQQVVAIETAKRLGYRVVVCDYLPDSPGHALADKSYPVSTTDREAVLEVAVAEQVEGVLAYASDPAAPTSAYVAEMLGLPTNSLLAVEVLSEKHLFRRFLSEHGFACPKVANFAAGTPVADVLPLVDGFTWPVVVKPTDSSGSKGVTVVDSPKELNAAIARATTRSRNGVLIAEEYIGRSYPAVIGGDVFVVDGQVRFWGLMDCLRSRLAGGLVPVGKAMPCGLASPIAERCKSEIRRLVSALDLRFGELNVELIVDTGGEPHFLELGARAGGNMIPIQLSDASGIDLVAANVRCAMGDDPGDLAWDGRTSEAHCAHYVLHSSSPGIFAGVEMDVMVQTTVYRTVLYKQPGDSVSAFDDAGDAVGIIFLKFESAEQMHLILENINDRVRVVLA